MEDKHGKLVLEADRRKRRVMRLKSEITKLQDKSKEEAEVKLSELEEEYHDMEGQVQVSFDKLVDLESRAKEKERQLKWWLSEEGREAERQYQQEEREVERWKNIVVGLGEVERVQKGILEGWKKG